MATSQHRCVFVGNIPYDATEERLIQICEEVGPVVSFRLVIDRETGKPKGYGFCEYKDEETALSARRNLQGYEINGRQLRVDFAENDKGADRNREQGRGGPGMTPNVGAPAILVNSAVHQPIGIPLASTAATLMAGALGGNQAATTNQSGLQSQTALGSDPLTLHLAKMSRNQLSEILSELKVMATQNKELARQLLLACPQLPKALFQAQIIVGMVTPQMLQMPNIRQAPGPGAPPSQPLLQDGQPGRPPLAHNKMQIGQVSAVSHPSTQPQIQLPQVVQNQGQQQTLFPGQFGISTVPSVRPQPLANFPMRPQTQVGTNSSSLKHQIQPQPPLPLQLGQVGGANSGHQSLQPSLLMRSLVSDPSFQPGSVVPMSTPETINKDTARSAQAVDDATWARQNNIYSNMPLRLTEKPIMARDTSEPMYHPSKLLKLDDGRNLSFSVGGATASTSSTGFGIGPLPVKQIPKAEAQHSGKQLPQFLADIDTSVLHQLLKLTPEQVSSLSPDQQQLVAQIQQSLQLPTD